MSSSSISRWIYRSLFFGLLVLGIWLSNSDSTPDVAVQQDADVHAENEGRLVFVCGTPSFSGRTSDTDLGIGIPAPVLWRHVSKSGQYAGMGFPYDLHGRRFVSDITLGGTLKLDSKFTELLIRGSSKTESDSHVSFSRTWGSGWKNVGRLPEKSVPAGLVYKRNMYSAPEGEPKFEISYQGYVFPKDIGTFCAVGVQKNGKLMLEGDGARLYDRPVDPRRIQRTMRQKSRYPFMGVMLFAMPLFVLGWSRKDD